MFKAALKVSICTLLLTFGIAELSPKDVEAATYNGRTPSSTNITYKPEAGVGLEQKYITTWNTAATSWNNSAQNRNSFSNNSSSSSVVTAIRDISNPGVWGQIVYQGGSGRSTPFRTWVNTARSDIRDNANVRRSTATHEFGHALGLGDVSSGNTIMNGNRTRSTLYTPTSLDVRNVNNR